jgi:hypothetical protein
MSHIHDTSFSLDRIIFAFILLLFVNVVSMNGTVQGFCVSSRRTGINVANSVARVKVYGVGNERTERWMISHGKGGDDVIENGGNSTDDDNQNEDAGTMYSDFEMFDDESDSPSPIPDFSWRVEKKRLEEANTRRFLKSKPRFLPYEECRKWVQAWGWWDSKEDWDAWIEQGEKRNSYIPTRPDEYYGKYGQWISWGHFLGKEEKGNSEEIQDFQ